MKKLLLLLSLSLMACVAETADEPENIESSLSPTQKSYAVPASLELNSVNPNVACQRVWDCERCSGNRNRNFVVEICDDGTQRRISTGPCGEPCH
jgi:hypothetical protein